MNVTDMIDNIIDSQMQEAVQYLDFNFSSDSANLHGVMQDQYNRSIISSNRVFYFRIEVIDKHLN